MVLSETTRIAVRIHPDRGGVDQECQCASGISLEGDYADVCTGCVGKDILSDLWSGDKAFQHCYGQRSACECGLYRHHSADAACTQQARRFRRGFRRLLYRTLKAVVVGIGACENAVFIINAVYCAITLLRTRRGGQAERLSLTAGVEW